MRELSRPRLPMYESRAAAMVLRLLRIADDVCHAVADEHRSVRDDDDTEKYSFAAFHTVLPTFPVHVCTALFTEDGPATARHVQVLLAHPRKSVLLRRYAMVASKMDGHGERESGSTPMRVGMHFPFGGLRGGMVLHNGNFGRADAPVTIIPTDKMGVLRLQSLASLVKAIRRGGWSPASRLPATGDLAVTPFVAAIIDPIIKTHLGRGASAMVFNVLAHAAESRAAGEHVRRLDERDGEIWLRVDQATLVRATGRNVRSVKQAIKTLIARGLLKARRDSAGNSYTVAPTWRDVVRMETSTAGDPQ